MFGKNKSDVRGALAQWLDNDRAARESGASRIEETAIARALAAVAEENDQTPWQAALTCIRDEAALSQLAPRLQQEERAIELAKREQEKARKREAENAAEIELRRCLYEQLKKSLAATDAEGRGSTLGEILAEIAAHEPASAAFSREIERKKQFDRERLEREREARRKREAQRKEAERQQATSNVQVGYRDPIYMPMRRLY